MNTRNSVLNLRDHVSLLVLSLKRRLDQRPMHTFLVPADIQNQRKGTWPKWFLWVAWLDSTGISKEVYGIPPRIFQSKGQQLPFLIYPDCLLFGEIFTFPGTVTPIIVFSVKVAWGSKQRPATLTCSSQTRKSITSPWICPCRLQLKTEGSRKG